MVGRPRQSVLGVRVRRLIAAPWFQLSEPDLVVNQPRIERVQNVRDNQQCGKRELHNERFRYERRVVHIIVLPRSMFAAKRRHQVPQKKRRATTARSN